MSSRTVALLAVGALALAPIMAPSAMAQGSPTAGFVGQAASSVPGCPNLVWRLARNGDNVTGIAYYSDLSGESHVTGTVNSDGTFTLQLTSAMGKGPVGTVTGQRQAKSAAMTLETQGALEADMKGEGCANMHLTMKPVVNLNTYGGAG